MSRRYNKFVNCCYQYNDSSRCTNPTVTGGSHCERHQILSPEWPTCQICLTLKVVYHDRKLGLCKMCLEGATIGTQTATYQKANQIRETRFPDYTKQFSKYIDVFVDRSREYFPNMYDEYISITYLDMNRVREEKSKKITHIKWSVVAKHTKTIAIPEIKMEDKPKESQVSRNDILVVIPKSDDDDSIPIKINIYDRNTIPEDANLYLDHVFSMIKPDNNSIIDSSAIADINSTIIDTSNRRVNANIEIDKLSQEISELDTKRAELIAKKTNLQSNLEKNNILHMYAKNALSIIHGDYKTFKNHANKVIELSNHNDMARSPPSYPMMMYPYGYPYQNGYTPYNMDTHYQCDNLVSDNLVPYSNDNSVLDNSVSDNSCDNEVLQTPKHRISIDECTEENPAA